MTPFLLDANVFIQAKNTYSSFEICPPRWSVDPSCGAWVLATNFLVFRRGISPSW